MSTAKRVLAGCVLLPVALIGSCCGKMSLDAAMYQLPGSVLKSTARPTQTLNSAMQVAEALDAYVQPRFEILRDKNFGAMRIVYRKHAGIVQLKVDSLREKELIANVNATNRDYAICLLHCAALPSGYGPSSATLEILYFNQQAFVDDVNFYFDGHSNDDAAQHGFDVQAVEDKANAALPKLMAGKEFRTANASWDILMRPVRAAKLECLGCHTEAKPAATLGVMVYAVRKARRNSTTTRRGITSIPLLAVKESKNKLAN